TSREHPRARPTQLPNAGRQEQEQEERRQLHDKRQQPPTLRITTTTAMRPPHRNTLNRTSPSSQRRSIHLAPTGKNSCRRAARIVDGDQQVCILPAVIFVPTRTGAPLEGRSRRRARGRR